MILVVFSRKDKSFSDFSQSEITDHWEAFQDLETAKERYDELIGQDDLYIANICNVIRSTDYATEA